MEELLASMDALTDLDGLAGDIPAADVPAEVGESVEELLDEISLDDLVEEGAEKVEAAAEAVAAAAPDEISFDSLEALFKNEQ